MAHYAQIINNKVVNVIVLQDDDLKTLEILKKVEKGQWIQTSYNSKGGIHYLPDSNIPSGKDHLRYNYAIVGSVYDSEIDAFYLPEGPFPSWILNKKTYQWEAPISMPIDVVITGMWDEGTKSWETVPSPYPSWICVNNTWQPPIPAPAETGWEWDELDRMWYKAHPLVPDAEEEQ